MPRPDLWSSPIPFGIGATKPHHYLEMLRTVWDNRRDLPYAWRILARGVCDGCALGVTGFSADSRVPGGRLLAICKNAGARRVMVVTNSSAIRMIGSTVALATGMSIRFFASRAEAFDAIERHERGD